MMIENSAIIILGASGDLARRKLIPALSELRRAGKISDSCTIIGSGRSEFSVEEFRKHVNADDDVASLIFYHRGIEGLMGYLKERGKFRTVIVFFSLPPRVYGRTAGELKREGFDKGTRIIIEKPFGYDSGSAQELNRELGGFFLEDQIYRIDHYLAKGAVQNILVFRFANSIFYPTWNAGFVESIQINAVEELGVESRGAYFDGAGVIRDMVQNHLMQMLALITMEPPLSLNAEDIREQKINILKSLEVVRCARGQYEGYRKEPMVDEKSRTETYAELELRIRNFRWEGVPVYIRTGKALGQKGTEIGIRFKRLPRLLYNESDSLAPNSMIVQIQPTTRIVIDHNVKVPGRDRDITRSYLDFSLSETFGQPEREDAYQRLLMDALDGDRTLYVGAKETELAWEVLDGVLDEGRCSLYRKGELPESLLGIDWIEFEEYRNGEEQPDELTE